MIHLTERRRHLLLFVFCQILLFLAVHYFFDLFFRLGGVMVGALWVKPGASITPDLLSNPNAALMLRAPSNVFGYGFLVMAAVLTFAVVRLSWRPVTVIVVQLAILAAGVSMSLWWLLESTTTRCIK